MLKRDETMSMSMNYAEYIVNVRAEGTLLLKKILTAVAFIVLFILGTVAVCGGIVNTPPLELLVIAFCGIGYFFVSGCFRIEYEYIVASAQVEFDAIYAQRRRKEKLTVSLDDVQRIAPYNDETAKYIAAQNVARTYDFCSSKASKRRYFMLVKKDGASFVIYFDAIAKTLDVMRFFRSSIVEIDKTIYEM